VKESTTQLLARAADAIEAQEFLNTAGYYLENQ
jgi:hypothetical protein